MFRLTRCLIALVFTTAQGVQAEPNQPNANQLIASLKAAKPLGGVYARVRMEQTSPAGKTVLQVQIKRRTTSKGSSEHLYQVLFPKERKGEALLLRISPKGFTGSSFVPGKGLTALKSGDRRKSLFGTDMTVEDLLADFLDWTQHTAIGHENIGTAACTMIESRPGSDTRGPSKVLSWIDDKRLAVMRIHIYDGGAQPARTVETEKLIRGDSGYYLPASFTIRTAATGSSTLLEGVRSDSGLTFTDADFTDTAMQVITGPSGK
jgi:hypothetical protein